MRAALAAALLLALAPAGAGAQRRVSEAASTSQTVAGTRLTVEYYRPVARGRTGLFGEVVRWGEVWTPGANWATTLEASRPVRVNGQPLAAGKYSLWMVVREQGDWTVLFHPTARRFHTQRPDTAEAVLRLTVPPREAPHLEVLTWSFPAVSRRGTTLQMQWGTTVIPLEVTVEGGRDETPVPADDPGG